MKSRIASVALVGALTLAALGSASPAVATPGKSKACSSCHRATTAVSITLKKKSSTSSKTTYSIKVSGGSGATGWAVFSGTKNIKHRSASTGTFTVARGKTYKVRAVRKSTGSAVKKLVVK